MSDGGPDPREQELGGFHLPLNSIEEPRELTLERIGPEKRVTIETGGPIEIVGYEADDVIKIMRCMAESPTDEAHWRPET